MIIFNPSKTSKLSLVSVNEILKEGLEKNKEITFYSGDIIKAFLKIEIGRERDVDYHFSQEQKNFIVLIKKLIL